MEIRFYNTLTRTVETLRPMEPGRIRMYTCGLTVYDYGHIGNYRTFVALDVIQRFLRRQGYQLTTVMNLTDVDDKMIERARDAHCDLREYGDIYAHAFQRDLALLNVVKPTHMVRATDYIPQMVRWIERLVETGHAYVSEGSVYFRIGSFPAYGRLSGKDLSELKPGARVESDTQEKEAVGDFALWKAQKPGEPAWPSPWGPGRPGWHIECTVMSTLFLGESFDIHAGGMDLIFPHHENEIAQAEAVTCQPFVHYWLHTAHLLVNGSKMSKSLGNVYTPRDLIMQGYHPSAIRYLLASAPYRHQLNFTFDGLRQASASVERLRNFRERLRREPLPDGCNETLEADCTRALERMRAAMADDFNTAEALAPVFEMVTAGNTALDTGQMRRGNQSAFEALLDEFDSLFDVLEDRDREKMAEYGVAPPGPSDSEVEDRIRQRTEARNARNFARADEIRRELDEAGVLVEDIKGGGVRWRRK